MAEEIPNKSKRQNYLDRIKLAKQPKQISQAQQHFIFKPNTIAKSTSLAICNAKEHFDQLD
jgi:hypothetical protein